MDRERIYSWYERYKNGIFRYVLSISKDPYLAEDVLHDTFVKLLSGEAPRNPDAAQAWLYRVARNLCCDHLRKAKRERPQAEAPVYMEDRLEYIDLISSLSPLEQEIVTLKIVGGLTHREIGSVLGITSKAAQKRYQRAITALRDEED